ncbi:MAG: CDP-alcohol phosphatidyltransferase family protein [Planctomycetota bacterium]
MSELKHQFKLREKSSGGLRQDELADDATEDTERTSTSAGLSRADLRKQKRRERRRVMFAVIPTMLTLGNGVCGLGAIAVAVSGDELDWPLEQKLFASGMLIFGGMLFDALDGSAARLTGQESEFGGQLDSLCDAVTFGTAPAVLIWRITDALPQRFLWAVGVLFTLCVLIRLARFNVETDEEDSHESFEGLPSPAAAGTLAAFAIALPDLKALTEDPNYPEHIQWVADRVLAGSSYFIPALAGVLAYFMVSRFNYPHLISQWARGQRPPHQIGQALFAVAGIFWLHWLALPIAFCWFAFASPLKAAWNSFRDRPAEQ